MELLVVLLIAFGLGIVGLGSAWSSERQRRKYFEYWLARERYDARMAVDARDYEIRRQWSAGVHADKLLGSAGNKLDQLQTDRQRLETGGGAVAARYVEDTHKWLLAKISPNNLESTVARFEKVVAFCTKHGFPTPRGTLTTFERAFRTEFKEAVRKEEIRGEQARIKEQIREEQKVERELQRANEQAQREEARLQDALARALKQADAEHSAEVMLLRSQIQALEEKKRKLSMAQQTKTGHVYVISNIGSFGEEVFKIGMTRRLEPKDRVDELGDASVPFPFDVHMMISSDDAPRLENALHRALHAKRVNKVSLRKEFFRAKLDEIVSIVADEHGHVDYRAEPEAEAYFETKAIEARGLATAPFVEAQHDEPEEELMHA